MVKVPDYVASGITIAAMQARLVASLIEDHADGGDPSVLAEAYKEARTLVRLLDSTESLIATLNAEPKRAPLRLVK